MDPSVSPKGFLDVHLNVVKSRRLTDLIVNFIFTLYTLSNFPSGLVPVEEKNQVEQKINQNSTTEVLVPSDTQL